MAYWIIKSEPSAYSWDQFVKDGQTSWTGVRNAQAALNLKAMKVGDRCFFYHSNDGKEIVGVAEVVLVEMGTVRSSPAVAVRYVLDADPTVPGSRTSPRRLPDSPHGRRELDDLHRQQSMAWKRTVWALKDELEVVVQVEHRTTRYGA